MSSEMNIHIFHECSGAHSHVYPQIMVPMQETMKIMVSDTEYEVTPQESYSDLILFLALVRSISS